MPIAHCMMSQSVMESLSGVDLVALWGHYSEQSTEFMTVNILPVAKQFGQPYAVMATLYLPNLWPEGKVKRLQEGLAAAFVDALNMTAEQVHVLTQIVDSGRVVENGKVVEW